MNIIKFKDILLDSSTGLSEDKIQLFNNSLKGKYSYVVNWIHVLPLESITQEDFIKLSLGGDLIDGTYIELTDIPQSYIDLEGTTKINNVDGLRTYNKYTTDSNITLDEIKKFRPWLAYTLLQQNISNPDIKHVLEYYNFDDSVSLVGAGMYDDVIKYLSTFGKTDLVFDSTTSTCGCGGVSFGKTSIQTYGISTSKKSYCDCVNIHNNTYNGAVSLCDPVAIYRKNIYAKMVDTFSDIDFWVQYKDSVLVDFVNYVKNIINTNLPLYTSSYISNYAECGCLNEKDLEQQTNIQILKNLEKSLTYIIEDKVDGNRNFISDSFTKWASLLYERMYWA
jgi:hypothetical protein